MLKGQCSEMHLAESGTSVGGFLFNVESRIFSADLPIPSHIRVRKDFTFPWELTTLYRNLSFFSTSLIINEYGHRDLDKLKDMDMDMVIDLDMNMVMNMDMDIDMSMDMGIT
jgi:hypothetical protein